MRKFVILAAIFCIHSGGPGTGTVSADDATEAEIVAREDAFSKSMSHCVLVGSFTIDGKESDGIPKAERYEIESVTKASESLWIFMTRVKYGTLDTKLPVTVPVEWAGDTPMVTLTNASLPGLGEGFSARVLFYQDRYAGTWQHGAIGGHMFGKIEHAKTAESKSVPK
jgi:hypothetical protein